VDTGTTAIGVPERQWKAVEEALCAATSAAASAPPRADGTNSSGPDPVLLHLDLDGLTLSIEPEEYAWRGDPRGEETAASPPQAANQGNDSDRPCRARVIPLDEHPDLGRDFLILGEPVLRRYYTVFDHRGPRIGFGEARHHSVDEDLPRASSVPPGGLLGRAAEPALAAIAARRAAVA